MTDNSWPTFGGLLASNLRVALAMLAFGAAAYGGWWLIAWLFPDLAWLQV